jgi:hypothetical protein
MTAIAKARRWASETSNSIRTASPGPESHRSEAADGRRHDEDVELTGFRCASAPKRSSLRELGFLARHGMCRRLQHRAEREAEPGWQGVADLYIRLSTLK